MSAVQGDSSGQTLALVDFDFWSSTAFPRCCQFCHIAAAQAELGRQWKYWNDCQQNLGSFLMCHPVQRCIAGGKFRIAGENFFNYSWRTERRTETRTRTERRRRRSLHRSKFTIRASGQDSSKPEWRTDGRTDHSSSLTWNDDREKCFNDLRRLKMTNVEATAWTECPTRPET